MKNGLCFLIILFFVFGLSDSQVISQEYAIANKCPYYSWIKSSDVEEQGILLNDGTVFIKPSDIPIVKQSADYCPNDFEYKGRTYFITKDSKGYDITDYTPVSPLEGIVKINCNYGILARSDIQNFLLAPVFDDIQYLDAHIVKVKKNGKYALYDVATNKMSDFIYDDVRIVKKGKFDHAADLTHYYVQKKTKFGWQYTSADVFRDAPARLIEDTILYYGLGGIIWDSIP